MTANERRTLGMDRPLQLEWLDAVAGQLASGSTVDEARAFTWKFLEGVVSGSTTQSARGKTLTVLARVWLTVPVANEPVRADALRLISSASDDQRVGIHWAMLFSAYPFFVDIAANIGTLFALNGDCSLAQLNRRLVSVWGDRSTVRTAAQRIVRSMVKWGVLNDGNHAGVYLPQKQRIALPASIATLVVEGLIIATESGIPLDRLGSHPATFPFDLRLTANDLRRHDRLRVYRQGDQSDLIERELARKSRVQALPAPTTMATNEKAPERSTKVGVQEDASCVGAKTRDGQRAASATAKKTMETTSPKKKLSRKKTNDRQLKLLPEDG